MRILYVACHGSGDADPEGAITHALTSLGHSVTCVLEKPTGGGISNIDAADRADLCLFHKWANWAAMSELKCPKVFWYFDMVGDDNGDPNLHARSLQRRGWLENAILHADLGFMTDGDAVAADTTGRLRWLTQGADQRVAGRGVPNPDRPRVSILFTGGIGDRRGGAANGLRRAEWAQWMRQRYGSKFLVVGNDTHGSKVVQWRLADLIAQSDIVVAPDGPQSDRYWSNRIYTTLGFGGFLLHPHCNWLSHHYVPCRDFVPYRDREELAQRIEHALEDQEYREQVSDHGLRQTLLANTYVHRCQELLRIVKEKLRVG